jgi:hypothetical protein
MGNSEGTIYLKVSAIKSKTLRRMAIVTTFPVIVVANLVLVIAHFAGNIVFLCQTAYKHW